METLSEAKRFGEFVYNKRIEREITLREFCRSLSFDPSNWSKIERCIANPPHIKMFLDEISDFLELTPDENTKMMYLAGIGHIPDDLKIFVFAEFSRVESLLEEKENEIKKINSELNFKNIQITAKDNHISYQERIIEQAGRMLKTLTGTEEF